MYLISAINHSNRINTKTKHVDILLIDLVQFQRQQCFIQLRVIYHVCMNVSVCTPIPVNYMFY